MANLIITEKLCIGCGKCVRVCPAKALEIFSKKAVVNEACVMCGQCVMACPVNAISLPSDTGGMASTESDDSIWVIAETHQGRAIEVSYELTSEAARLSKISNLEVVVVITEEVASEMANSFFKYGADRVLMLEDRFETLPRRNELDVVNHIVRLTDMALPKMMLVGATGYGRSIAPRIAARLKTGLTADCTILSIDSESGDLIQTRPAFGGNLMASIVCPKKRPQMATVRPGIMIADDTHEAEGTVEIIKFELPRVESLKVLEEVIAPKAASISDAKVIVTAGRGVESVKALKVIRAFAEEIGAELGVTRPLVDLGWEDYHRQIGQTGATVAPDLLITFGVSGAIQHLAGIMQAKEIIAINTDPEAPIFNIAHYCVTGDCLEAVEKLKSVLGVKP